MISVKVVADSLRQDGVKALLDLLESCGQVSQFAVAVIEGNVTLRHVIL